MKEDSRTEQRKKKQKKEKEQRSFNAEDTKERTERAQRETKRRSLRVQGFLGVEEKPTGGAERKEKKWKDIRVRTASV
jgi:hypothetical protein